MARKPWSFKEDRRLMELAKSSASLEEAAKVLGRSPDAVKRMALRLGLSLKSKTGKRLASDHGAVGDGNVPHPHRGQRFSSRQPRFASRDETKGTNGC